MSGFSKPTEELLECLDILMAEVERIQAWKEYAEMCDAFDEYYRLDGRWNLDDWLSSDIAEEFEAQEDVLYAFKPPMQDGTALMTALWQTPELALGLLVEHMQAIDDLERLGAALQSQAGKPKLYLADGSTHVVEDVVDDL